MLPLLKNVDSLQLTKTPIATEALTAIQPEQPNVPAEDAKAATSAAQKDASKLESARERYQKRKKLA
jgi:hypothetical protein